MTQKNKTVFVILDGLGYDTALNELGYMEAMVAAYKASRWKVKTSLPSNSRPLYETLMTGLPPVEHGVLTNKVIRETNFESIFSVATGAGLKTAAAAFSWFSELYVKTPYDPIEDREINDGTGVVHNARFYEEEDYPDIELFMQATRLIRHNNPDFMLLHPMGCDYKGHVHGGHSPQYQKQASKADHLLATHIPEWLERGYQVFVTADHGMDEKGWHGGTRDDVQYVALYHIDASAQFSATLSDTAVDQCAVAPTILKSLGLTIPAQMKIPALI